MIRVKMEFHGPLIFAFLTLALVATHASLTPELYWKSVLPNTPMPNAVTDLLQPDFLDEKRTRLSLGNDGVNANAGKGKPGTTVNVGKGGVNVNTGKGKPGGGTSVNVGGGSVGVNTGKPGSRTKVGVGKGGVSVNTGHKGKPVYVGVGKGPNPFLYKYAATETQLKEDLNVALFFLEKDVHFGKTMNLNFREQSSKATFLPRQVANSIPFSSNKLPEIFDEFSVKPGSLEAQTISKTIEECEAPGIKGEEKYCATSLESMIDFSTSKLGKQVQAISTEADNQTQMKSYTVQGVKEMTGDKSVVCHKQNYAYAIFYCHATQTTKAYTVSLKSADGTEVKAVAVCHTDTSAWNPKHLAFQVLKVKPGTLPVCHFLPQDHIVWVPN